MRTPLLVEGVLAALILSVAPGEGLAVPMAYQFTGVVDSVHDYNSVLDGSVQPGTKFSGQFNFDSDALDLYSDPSLGLYGGPAFSMWLTVGSYSWFSGAENGDVHIQDADVGDNITLGADSFNAGGNIDVSMSFWFWDPTGNVWATDSLPIDNSFPFSSFSNGLGVKGNNLALSAYFDFGGQLTSFTIVPEPSTLLLLMVAFGLLRHH